MVFSTEESTGVPDGPLALTVHPSGRASLARLSGAPPVMAQVVSELVGGNLELLATGGGPVAGMDTWLAYINEDGGRLGLPANLMADAMARMLGYPFGHGDYLKGVAVFLGRAPGNVVELDVPDYVLDLARAAGVRISTTPSPSVIP